jgi:hypothetical protein
MYLIRMFWYIAKNIYSHPCFKIFAQIYIQIFDLMQKIRVAANIHFRAKNIRFRFSDTGKYLLQNIRLEANICKTANFTFKRIFAWMYSHTGEYSLANIRIPANIRYVLLQII